MRIIDIHTHIYPDEIARKAADSVKTFYGGIGDPTMDGTEQLLLSRGRQAGIDRFAILPVAIRPERVKAINDFVRQQAQANSRFIPFGTAHAAMEGVADEAERIMGYGAKGIKMHPDSQGFSIDDPRLFPLYETVQGRIPVIFHVGDLRYNHSHPARLRSVLEQFPKLDVIGAHFGGFRMHETALEFLRDTSCVLDTSSSVMFMEEGVPERLIRLYGAERIAFGSDFPLFDPVHEVERIDRLILTDAEKEQIFCKTAEQILNLQIPTVPSAAKTEK